MTVAEAGTKEIQKSAAPRPNETCPRCHTTKLWGQMSWCPDCGYYPVVDSATSDGTSWADNLPDVPQETDDHRTALQSIPTWFWAMMGGIIAIAGFSITIRLNYPADNGPRGMFALAQLSIGLSTTLVAHIMATRFAMKSDRRVNFNDVLLSWFNVWQPTITALPDTCKRVWAFVWGGIAVMTAVTIIGGIDYSAPFRTHEAPETKPLSAIGKVAAAARAGADQDTSMEEALGDIKSQVEETAAANGGIADGAPKTMKEALKEPGDKEKKLDGQNDSDSQTSVTEEGVKERQEIECFVYGVVTDENNIPLSLLYAANTLGQNQHVAEINTKDLPRDKFRSIAIKLYKEVQRTPAIPSERNAVWVRPTVLCRLSFAECTRNGELTDAKFDAIIVNQPGRFKSSQFDSQHRHQRR